MESFTPGQVTLAMKQQFEKDGYLLIRALLTSEELSRLNEDIVKDNGIIQHSFVVPDGHGGCSRMSLWNHPGSDITGMVGRCQKVAGTMGELLGGEVYHYHTKLMMKEAHTGGSFVWHQDYGYWYNNGCLFPDMGTVFIAVDKCDKENGCLKISTMLHIPATKLGMLTHLWSACTLAGARNRVQFTCTMAGLYNLYQLRGILPTARNLTQGSGVGQLLEELRCPATLPVSLVVLKGSHHLGRINHNRVGGQMGADMDRVEHVMKVLPLVEVEMGPGDALFFHSNVLHRSDKNESDRRRWAFLISYNRASNNPVMKHHHPQYTKLELQVLLSRARNTKLLKYTMQLSSCFLMECRKLSDRACPKPPTKSTRPSFSKGVWQVPDSAIMDHKSTSDEFQGKDFMDPADDHTTSGKRQQ